MTDNTPDFDTLSAYVDGELSAREMALVARLAASDPQVALRIEKLSALKNAVAGFAEPAGVLVVSRAKPAVRRPAIFVWVAAACLLALILGGAIYWRERDLGGPVLADVATLDGALSLYDSWSAGTAGRGAAHPVADFDAPRLDSAGLFLQLAEPRVMIGNHVARQFGYVGVHGCHLSLFSWNEIGGAGGLELDLSNNIDMASWEASGARYLLVSRRMNGSRFAIIAGALRQITDTHGRPDTETVELLGSAHQPCVSTG